LEAGCKILVGDEGEIEVELEDIADVNIRPRGIMVSAVSSNDSMENYLQKVKIKSKAWIPGGTENW
jgi:hypothetical protein